FGPFTLPGSKNTPAGRQPPPGPWTLSVRSDYAGADQFVNVVTPAMADLETTIETVRVTCVGQLTISCQDALIETDNQTQSMITLLSKDNPPPCIATQASKVQADLSTLHSSLQATLKGFADSNSIEFRKALGRYATSVYALRADIATVSAAEPTCSKEQTGP
ncbi:MAG: hypothetical protein ACREOM_05775, partial [Candidatus Dormibacteraceae bacterium]